MKWKWMFSTVVGTNTAYKPIPAYQVLGTSTGHLFKAVVEFRKHGRYAALPKLKQPNPILHTSGDNLKPSDDPPA